MCFSQHALNRNLNIDDSYEEGEWSMLILNICPKSPKSHYNILKKHNFEKPIQYVQIYLN
jgi:hypothetical protein